MFRGGFLECGAPKRRLVQRPAEKLRLCPVRGRVARRSHFVLLSLKDVAESLSASRTKSAPDGGGSRPALPRVCRKLLPLVACSFLTKVFSRRGRKGRRETIGLTPRFPENRILLLYESVFSAINKLFN